MSKAPFAGHPMPLKERMLYNIAGGKHSDYYSLLTIKEAEMFDEFQKKGYVIYVDGTYKATPDFLENFKAILQLEKI